MLTKFAKPYEKSHEKNLNCFERYDALFQIKNNFQILVLGTPEGYPALDPFNFIKVDSKFGIMTQSNVHVHYWQTCLQAGVGQGAQGQAGAQGQGAPKDWVFGCNSSTPFISTAAA